MFIKFLIRLIVFTFLTVITQVGGIIYLLFMILWPLFTWKSIRNQVLFRTVGFIGFYLICCLTIVPLTAQYFGRSPLPLKGDNIRPLNLATVALNRHYVNTEFKDFLMAYASEKNDYPITYLDANFPFIDGFPLLPHLSHDDGNKLDLCFIYTRSGELAEFQTPSIIGYGVYESPKKGEQNMAAYCHNQGYWQYGILESFIPQWEKDNYEFSPELNRKLIMDLVQRKEVRRIYIEPHLKSRLNLTSEKIRFHGCQAVRHDDHIHLEYNP